MSGYSKKMIALGIAAAAVLVTGLWTRGRFAEFTELSDVRDEMRAHITLMGEQGYMVERLEERRMSLDDELGNVIGRFACKDYGTPQLVMDVVNAAGASGMEMVNVFKVNGKHPETSPAQPHGLSIRRLTHDIRLRGTYAGLVRFMRAVGDWNVVPAIEAMEILPGSASGDDADPEKDVINVMLRLSVCVMGHETEKQ